jgi:hypothetical protein
VNVAVSQAAHRGNNAPLRTMLNELVDDTIDVRDVLGERAPASAAPTVARDNEPRR